MSYSVTLNLSIHDELTQLRQKFQEFSNINHFNWDEFLHQVSLLVSTMIPGENVIWARYNQYGKYTFICPECQCEMPLFPGDSVIWRASHCNKKYIVLSPNHFIDKLNLPLNPKTKAWLEAIKNMGWDANGWIIHYLMTSRRPGKTIKRRAKLYGFKLHCRLCGSGVDLLLHHIDGDHKNNSKSNLVCLCSSCHSMIHSGEWCTMSAMKIGEVRRRLKTPETIEEAYPLVAQYITLA